MSFTTSSSSLSIESASTSEQLSIVENILNLLQMLDRLEMTKLCGYAHGVNDAIVEQKWNLIRVELDEMSDEGRIDIPFYYTKILEYHLTHAIHLAPVICQSLLYCTQPNHINELFKRNLIEKECKKLFVLLENEFLFIGIEELDSFPYAYGTLLSISLLMYRLQVHSCKRGIKYAIFDRLVEFCLHETFDALVRDVAIKILLESLVLNGILTLFDVRIFLASHCGHRVSDNRDIHINQNLNHNHDKTVAEMLHINQQQNYSLLPLSLKNLTRIVIKNCLMDYGQRSVSQLQIPDSMKSFLLFDDKIDEILKATLLANA